MRILTYNIQAGINSHSYTSYTYQWHKQFLPAPGKVKALKNIAQFINGFDVVCLQEIELGGLRNAFKSQAQQLLELTDFQYSVWQINRKVGKVSLHGNMILAKKPFTKVLDVALPSRIPGRGVLAIQTAFAEQSLVVANVHLSLGKLDQYRQLRFIRTKLSPYPNVAVMGDFNCTPEANQLQILTDHGYRLTSPGEPTFPTWQPKKSLDHIFLKGNLHGLSETLDFAFSDHFPVMLEL